MVDLKSIQNQILSESIVDKNHILPLVTAIKEMQEFTGGIVDVTYSELISKISNSELIAGCNYKITDFQTVHYFTDIQNNEVVALEDINYGDVEPLIVTALSSNTIHSQVKSTVFPQDIILYDWNINHFNSSEEVSIEYTDICFNVPENIFKGVILFRHDISKGLSTYYDWRNVKYRRWRIEPNSGIYDPLATYSYNDTVFKLDAGQYYIQRMSRTGWEIIRFHAISPGTLNTTEILNLSPCSDISEFPFGDANVELFTINSNSYSDIKTFGALDDSFDTHISFWNKTNPIGITSMLTRLNGITFSSMAQSTTFSSNCILNIFAGYSLRNIFSGTQCNFFTPGILNSRFGDSIHNVYFYNLSSTGFLFTNASTLENCYMSIGVDACSIEIIELSFQSGIHKFSTTARMIAMANTGEVVGVTFDISDLIVQEITDLETA